jgi:hypothetical protein
MHGGETRTNNPRHCICRVVASEKPDGRLVAMKLAEDGFENQTWCRALDAIYVCMWQPEGLRFPGVRMEVGRFTSQGFSRASGGRRVVELCSALIYQHPSLSAAHSCLRRTDMLTCADASASPSPAPLGSTATYYLKEVPHDRSLSARRQTTDKHGRYWRVAGTCRADAPAIRNQTQGKLAVNYASSPRCFHLRNEPCVHAAHPACAVLATVGWRGT